MQRGDVHALNLFKSLETHTLTHPIETHRRSIKRPYRSSNSSSVIYLASSNMGTFSERDKCVARSPAKPTNFQKPSELLSFSFLANMAGPYLV